MPVFDKELSKIKMVILTKHGQENLPWYSPINQNKRDSRLVISGMITRFRRHRLATVTNKLQFYESGILIHEERL
ncbi:MAG TPA: hypothetical protein VF581_07835 [Flavobacterium sp.]|jgi:hypothetical protein